MNGSTFGSLHVELAGMLLSSDVILLPVLFELLLSSMSNEEPPNKECRNGNDKNTSNDASGDGTDIGTRSSGRGGGFNASHGGAGVA